MGLLWGPKLSFNRDHHSTSCFKIFASSQKVNIALHSASLTDEFQPLNRTLFGILKTQAKRLFHARLHANPDGRRTKQVAVAEMITTWPILGAPVIENIWDLFIINIYISSTHCLLLYFPFCCLIMRFDFKTFS
jgi:hypothetical protein